MIIITDFELIKEAFNKKELSDRVMPESWNWYRETAIKEYRLRERALEILGPESRLIKNGKNCIVDDGVGLSYNAHHRSNRQMWRHASARLVGKPRIREITLAAAKQV